MASDYTNVVAEDCIGLIYGRVSSNWHSMKKKSINLSNARFRIACVEWSSFCVWRPPHSESHGASFWNIINVRTGWWICWNIFVFDYSTGARFVEFPQFVESFERPRIISLVFETIAAPMKSGFRDDRWIFGRTTDLQKCDPLDFLVGQLKFDASNRFRKPESGRKLKGISDEFRGQFFPSDTLISFSFNF